MNEHRERILIQKKLPNEIGRDIIDDPVSKLPIIYKIQVPQD